MSSSCSTTTPNSPAANGAAQPHHDRAGPAQRLAEHPGRGGQGPLPPAHRRGRGGSPTPGLAPGGQWRTSTPAPTRCAHRTPPSLAGDLRDAYARAARRRCVRRAASSAPDRGCGDSRSIPYTAALVERVPAPPGRTSDPPGIARPPAPRSIVGPRGVRLPRRGAASRMAPRRAGRMQPGRSRRLPQYPQGPRRRARGDGPRLPSAPGPTRSPQRELPDHALDRSARCTSVGTRRPSSRRSLKSRAGRDHRRGRGGAGQRRFAELDLCSPWPSAWPTATHRSRGRSTRDSHATTAR